MRVPSPPAKITHCILLNENLGALEVEAEAHLAQPGLTHGVAQLRFLLGVKHQKASAAGADELPAQSAIVHGVGVPLVDLTVAHRTRALFLALPVHVHEAGEL